MGEVGDWQRRTLAVGNSSFEQSCVASSSRWTWSQLVNCDATLLARIRTNDPTTHRALQTASRRTRLCKLHVTIAFSRGSAESFGQMINDRYSDSVDVDSESHRVELQPAGRRANRRSTCSCTCARVHVGRAGPTRSPHEQNRMHANEIEAAVAVVVKSRLQRRNSCMHAASCSSLTTYVLVAVGPARAVSP